MKMLRVEKIEKMEKKRKCELCGDAAATMYCESDAASLCFKCDEKVHGANFLVAKHERSLLCSVCQSVTSWKASGPKLGRTVSVCDVCVCDMKDEDEAVKEEEEVVVEVESRDRSDGDEEPDGSSDDEDEENDDEDEDDAEEEIEEEDEENQVVPWSSGEEVLSSSICDRELKRRRDISDLDSDEEIEDGGGSSHVEWYRSRTSTRLIGLNRNPKEIKPTTAGFRAGNQTSIISG